MRTDLGIFHALSRWLLAAATLWLAGCAGAAVENPAPLSAVAAQGQPRDYVIQPGDAMTVKFFYNPELNEDIVVRPDGRISLQLVGEQQASGLTPGQLERQLTQQYDRELKNPKLAVILKSFGGQRAYVSGEVTRPGVVDIVGDVSVLQSIAASGGFTDRARRNEVILIRRGPDGRPVPVSLNLEDFVKGLAPQQDVRLQPYDIVYVPRSAVGDLNVFIDQYIRQNIPIPFGLGYTLGGD
ncbi:MAG: polysaccharide biosynthesis/export family protein [Rhodospirillales bacterium]|nr:polysaccharide biosynthesis/export family protein [Rhodospirillales bacterium]